MSISRIIPPKWKPWLNSLLGGSVLLLAWFFLDQAERVQLAKLSRLSEPASGGQVAATGTSGMPPAPAPTSPPPAPPSYKDDDRDDGAEVEWEDDEDEYGDGGGSGQTTPSSPPTDAAPAPSPAPAPAPPPTVTPAEGIYRDGAYSATAQAPWGSMSITVKVSGGRWTSIETPAIPDSPPSYRAVPLLVQQALQAQSAAIDGVSGATYTSDAFRDDLRQIAALSKR